MHGEDNNLGSWDGVSNPARGLKAIQIGHTDIKDGYVRFQPICFFHCFPAVDGLADDGPAASSAKESTYAAPDELVVVRNQDTKLLRATSHLPVSSHAPSCRRCWIQYQAGRLWVSLARACSGCQHRVLRAFSRSVAANFRTFRCLCRLSPV